MGVLEDLAIPLDLEVDLDPSTLILTADDNSDGGDTAVAARAAPAPQRKRDLKMQKQQQSQWCWAATTVSITRFYEQQSTLTQCQLVNLHFGRSDCCSQPSSSNCNRPSNTGEALNRVGHLREDRAGVLTFQQIQDEVNLARPIAIRIAWSGGGAHAIALDGYATSGTTQWVYGDDPGSGNSFVATYNSFKTAYNGTGTWDRSRLTKA